MGTSCVIPGCSTRYKRGKGTKFYCIPFTAERRKKWLTVCPFLKRYSETQLDNIRFCSKHFSSHHITNTNRLTRDAIPTLHIFNLERRKILGPVLQITPLTEERSDGVVRKTILSQECETPTESALAEDTVDHDLETHVEAIQSLTITVPDKDEDEPCEASSKQDMHFVQLEAYEESTKVSTVNQVNPVLVIAPLTLKKPLDVKIVNEAQVEECIVDDPLELDMNDNEKSNVSTPRSMNNSPELDIDQVDLTSEGDEARTESPISVNKPSLLNDYMLEPKNSEITMAMIPYDYPDTEISPSTMVFIQKIICDSLLLTSGALPKIQLGDLAVGALLFTCYNRNSRIWLERFDGISINLIKYKVVSAKELSKLRSQVAMSWESRYMGASDDNSVLKLIQRYNPQLHTGKWKVVETVIKEDHVRRIVFMDQKSARVVRALNYSVFCGLDWASFQLLEDTNVDMK